LLPADLILYQTFLIIIHLKHLFEMEDNKTFLVITAIVNKQNIAEVPEYLGSVMQIFGQNGGKPVGRYKTINPLVGDESPEMVAVIEFANPEIIENLVKSEAFNTLAEQRARVFTNLNMFISQNM
jgi:uncharacterized protein (DUF1330 family)